ncbi:putative K domain-like, alpha/beta protein [Helianthus annuus]|nr:putative K domain-like, alpha/beta protein [Helianthus annuus]
MNISRSAILEAESLCHCLGRVSALQAIWRPYCSQFVVDGVFFAELNEVLTRELAEGGYSGVEVRREGE